jgi:hypothetical protein
MSLIAKAHRPRWSATMPMSKVGAILLPAQRPGCFWVNLARLSLALRSNSLGSWIRACSSVAYGSDKPILNLEHHNHTFKVTKVSSARRYGRDEPLANVFRGPVGISPRRQIYEASHQGAIVGLPGP